MRDGEVVAERPPEEIQDDPLVRAIYLGDGGAH
jgi:ABC-type branched-subunit amino acid transport system ATPase component